MKKECKISKSVRLSQDQISYIEEQEGKDFSAKLSGLLEEFKSGEAERKKKIAWYKGMVREYDRQLNGYRDLLFRMHRIGISLSSMEKSVAGILDLFPPEGASNDNAAK